MQVNLLTSIWTETEMPALHRHALTMPEISICLTTVIPALAAVLDKPFTVYCAWQSAWTHYSISLSIAENCDQEFLCMAPRALYPLSLTTSMLSDIYLMPPSLFIRSCITKRLGCKLIHFIFQWNCETQAGHG